MLSLIRKSTLVILLAASLLLHHLRSFPTFVVVSQPDMSDMPPRKGLCDEDKYKFDASDSSQDLKSKRARFNEMCRTNEATLEGLQLELQGWHQTGPMNQLSCDCEEKNPSPCIYTFLDFGANVGDSLVKFIDAGIPVCENKELMRPRTNLDTLQVSEFLTSLSSAVDRKRLSNKLIEWIRRQMDTSSAYVGRDLQPEDYCYFGIEGNHVFTDRLRALKKRVHLLQPRPVRNVHFYTETVAVAVDGPTVLYLDIVNTAQNFWGSSVIPGHADVQRSARKSGGNIQGTPVAGKTLSTVLRETVVPVAGAHVMIKMDIEGAEYAVLNEAVETLCQYAAANVTVDLLAEMHNPRIVGTNGTSDIKVFKDNQCLLRLERCGVRYFNLGDPDFSR